MIASKLKLEHYSLASIRLEANTAASPLGLGTYADFSNATYKSHVGYKRVKTEDDAFARYTVQLSLEAEPVEGKDFPYSFAITLVGFFDGTQLEDAKRDALVCTNGASLLYGVAREVILSLSQRGFMGQVLLPTVHFSDVGQDILDKAGNAPSSVPQIEETKAASTD